MKNLLIMILAIFLSLSSYGQKYKKVIDQNMSEADLKYMPLHELGLLKNDIIASNKSNSTKATKSPKVFLDKTSEANVLLIRKLETGQIKMEKAYSDLELYNFFIDSIKHHRTIPFHLQTLFFSYCQNPEADINLIPVSENFNTVAISEKPMIGPERHYVITFDLKGNKIDSKSMNGKAKFEDNKIIHESYNSLIEYTYTIDEQGHFDKKTPTKE